MRISHLKSAVIVAIATAAVFSTHLTASSQPVLRACGPNGPGMVAHLQKEGERLERMAFTASGKIVYVMVDPEDRRYSIVTVAPDNEGCLISLGTDWEWLEPDQ